MSYSHKLVDIKKILRDIISFLQSTVTTKKNTSAQALSSKASSIQSEPVKIKHVNPDKHRTERFEPTPIDFNLPERFFLWLSKTDLHAAWIVASNETVMTQKALGWMVLSTGIFAFMSSYYAIHSAVLNEPGTINACLTALIGLFYSCAIMMWSRKIISTHPDGKVSKWKKIKTNSIRLMISAFIGFVLSFPIELKVLDGAIQEQIGRDLKEVNAGLQTEINAKSLEIKRLNKLSSDLEIEKLNAEILNVQAEAKKIQEDMDYDKKGGADKGPKWKEDQEKLIVKQQETDALNKKFQDAVSQKRQDPVRLKKIADLEREAQKLNEIRDENETNAATDFLLRARALHHLEDGINTPRSMSDASRNDQQTQAISTVQQHSSEMASSSSDDQKDFNTPKWDWPTILIVWFLRAAFVLFEVLPVIIKMSMADNEYHAYINCRRAFERQKKPLLA